MALIYRGQFADVYERPEGKCNVFPKMQVKISEVIEEVKQLFGVSDLKNLDRPTAIRVAKEINTRGAKVAKPERRRR